MMKPLSAYAISDLKLIYQMLHERLPSDPMLMDSELLQDLQTYLQQQARDDGIDVSLHAQWSSWLNDGTSIKGL
jgi:hypothetical protein